MRSQRLLDLVGLLRRHDRLTAAELAGRLGVSRRTVLRDLDALSLSGVPVYAAHGRHGGFAILPGYRPPATGLTPGEAEALFLPGGEPAASALGRLAEFRSARAKIESVLSDETSRALAQLPSWLIVVPEGWRQPVDPPRWVPELAAACAQHEIVELDYRARGQQSRLRSVRPVGLVLAGSVWYLVAERDDSGAQRTYRVDRIGSVSPSGRHFEPQVELDAAWAQARQALHQQDGVRVTLRASSEAVPVVRYVAELAGRVLPTATDDSDTTVKVLVRHLPVAAALFAGLDDRAEILDPPELRAAVVAISERNLARYRPA